MRSIPQVLLLLSILTLIGCKEDMEGLALIDDPSDPHHEVMLVDGESPKRIESSIHTKIPYAIVEAGTRHITIGILPHGLLHFDELRIAEIQVEIEEKAIYQIESDDHGVRLVKKNKKDANQAAHTTPAIAPR